MVTNEHVKAVEAVIGYNFKQRWLICQALTAAGAEEDNYDGNRQLSQLGASLVDTILAILMYNTGVNRGNPNRFLREEAVICTGSDVLRRHSKAQTNLFEQRALFYNCQTDRHRSMHQTGQEDRIGFSRSPS